MQSAIHEFIQGAWQMHETDHGFIVHGHSIDESTVAEDPYVKQQKAGRDVRDLAPFDNTLADEPPWFWRNKRRVVRDLNDLEAITYCAQATDAMIRHDLQIWNCLRFAHPAEAL